MRVAIPNWKERVSPVFDVAKHLLLVDIQNSTEVARWEKTIDETDLMSRARYVADLGVEILICGAISRPLKTILEARGIDVIGQVCGNTKEILEAFLRGSLNDHSFLMPGCKAGTEDFRPLTSGNGDDLTLRESHMRVAITSQGPDLTSQVDPRFGRAKYLIVTDTESGKFIALDNSRNLNAAQGAGIQTVRDVVNKGVDAVFTGQVGPKALEALESARVQVFLGASGTVKDALNELKSGLHRSRISGRLTKEEVQLPGSNRSGSGGRVTGAGKGQGLFRSQKRATSDQVQEPIQGLRRRRINQGGGSGKARGRGQR